MLNHLKAASPPTTPYCYEATEFTRVKGQVTGSKVKNLDDNLSAGQAGTWLKSVNYYDDRYRVIQTITNNQKGGIDRTSNLYDFVGKVLETKTSHNDGSTINDIKRNFDYDHAGRLMAVKHQLNTEPEVTLVTNEYNELGELVDKKLHSADGTNFEQSVDYRYNIRGWLTRINDAALSETEASAPKDYFGMELLYNTEDISLNNAAAYNGNISAMKWSGSKVDEQLSYGYTYDPMNRLKTADHKTIGMANATDFDVNNLSYDFNGNIQALTRYDKNGAMDVLNYDYGTGLAKGNRLLSVSDAGTTEGFKDGNTTGDDYGYDANGNMTQDLNKDITRISYNYLNLPDTVEKSTGEYIRYIYDAAGIKLAQEVYNAGDTLQKRTDYIGEFIYENDTLQIIQHEEGRIVPNAVTGAFEYQYKIADHLGNTRLMFTSVPKTIEFALNYESDPNNADDEALFKNVNIGAVGDYNSTSGAYQDATPYSHAQVLYSSPNSQTGSILAIPVGKGDQISATVNAKYIDAPANGSVVAGSIAASLINAFTGSVNGVTEGGTSTINGSFGNDPLIGTAGFDYEDVNAPKAFLNMMFLPEDESISLVNGSTFMYDQIADGSIEAVIDGTSQSAFDVLTIQDFEATQSGYILVYVSNEGSLTDVYFDDLSVTVNESKIIQEASYYPFGYQMAGGYIRTTAKETKYLYNGFERQDALDWGVYDYLARYYDPVIGRFLNVDPAADLMRRHSPYNYAFDNPIRFIDPDGMKPEDKVENCDTCKDIWSSLKTVGKKLISSETYEEVGKGFVHAWDMVFNGAEGNAPDDPN